MSSHPTVLDIDWIHFELVSMIKYRGGSQDYMGALESFRDANDERLEQIEARMADCHWFSTVFFVQYHHNERPAGPKGQRNALRCAQKESIRPSFRTINAIDAFRTRVEPNHEGLKRE